MDRVPDTQQLETAVNLARGHQKRDAESLLRHLIASGLRHPKACMVLGVLCGERGDLGQRRLWFEQARYLGDLSGEPPALRLLLNQSVDALEQGASDQALAFGEEALRLYPEEISIHLHLARLLHHFDRGSEADDYLQQAKETLVNAPIQDSKTYENWKLLAQAQVDMLRLDDALETYRQLLQTDANDLASLLAISKLLIQKKSIDEALPWLLNALALDPDHVEVLYLNAFVLKEIGETKQAEGLLRQALAIHPHHLSVSQLLVSCLIDQGIIAEASTICRDVLKQHPKDYDSRLRLAVCLRGLGEMGESLQIQKELMADEPQNFGMFSSWMFTTSICDIASTEEVLATADQFWRGIGTVDDLPNRALGEIISAEHRPLRVAILSADIGEHVVGLFLETLLRHHDPRRCQLELLSMHRHYDKMSEDLVSLADGFHNLEGLTIQEARHCIQKEHYDLIVDVSGHTRDTGLYLLAERCAPVQAHYIGYHATTGLSTIDAFIGDEETAAHDLQPQFCERLWRLPRPWLAFPREHSFPRSSCRIETQRPVLGSFSQQTKISDTTLTFWAEAMRRVPEAVLMLKSRGLEEQDVRQRLEDRLQRHGIHPGRLTFVAPVEYWVQHLEHYNYIDIALDTTPWSNATTAFEALGMGVPLVAIRGSVMAARMGSSLVKGLGREEWISDTPETFADIVAKLCDDLSNVRAGKAKLQEEVMQSALFDGQDLAQEAMKLFTDLVTSRLDLFRLQS
jgi:protein O-GlcNAc transferase